MKTGINWKKRIYAAALILPLTLASCGARVDNPGPVSDAGETPPGQEACNTAAADFYYVEMDYTLSGNIYQSYAINQEWLYITDRMEPEEGGPEDDGKMGYFSLTRKRISDSFLEKDYAVTAMEWLPFNEPLLLADRDGNCYIYWKLHPDYWSNPDGEAVYRLEKYGADGGLQWGVELAQEELGGMAENLNQGVVTGDGRVILYSEGKGGCIFVFGTEGSLEKMYAPELESLEGVAAGKENRIYGYCITGKEPVFTELGGEEKNYVCPVTPLAVYSGYGEGISLRTGEGMFAYTPESGETERLWSWTDEYIQIDGNKVDRVFQDGGFYMLLCLEMSLSGIYNKQILTFSSITPGKGGESPARQAVTLATDWLNPDMALLVQMYNRQSGKYRIEINNAGNGKYEDYEKKLIQGDDGIDLMEVGRIYTGDLARHGAFEELDAYYKDSPAVSGDDILGSVLKAGCIEGKNVATIVAFGINTLRARGDFVTPEEWTVWKFLEMGEQGQMFSCQDPQLALRLCMGLRYGEHFVDHEKKTCSFDSEDFRRILEACSRWKTYDDGSNVLYSQKQGDWLFDEQYIHNVRTVVPQNLGMGDMYEYTGEDYLSTLVGYPGWEGGEYKLQPSITLAINSASGNKEGAWDFLEYLLSEKTQSIMAQASGYLPVRKDCFDACIRTVYTDSLYIEIALPEEEDIMRVQEMAETAIKDNLGNRTNPIWTIVTEEAEMYFAGDASLDVTVQKIQSRVQLYLDEH